MDIIAIAAMCITACIACKAIEQGSGEIKTVLTIAAVILVGAKAISGFGEVSSVIRELFLQAEMDEQYLTIIFKGIGICYVTQLACDCCRDCGENALATQLELAGKAAMIIISLPLFRAVIGIVEALLI